MAKKERQWTNCAHCNRVLWVGDPCDCPASKKPNAPTSPKTEDEQS